MNHLILIQLVNFKPIDSSFKINAFSMAMKYSTRVRWIGVLNILVVSNREIVNRIKQDSWDASGVAKSVLMCRHYGKWKLKRFCQYFTTPFLSPLSPFPTTRTLDCVPDRLGPVFMSLHQSLAHKIIHVQENTNNFCQHYLLNIILKWTRIN